METTRPAPRGTSPTHERLTAMLGQADPASMGPLGAFLPALSRTLGKVSEDDLRRALSGLVIQIQAVLGDEVG